MTEVVRVDPARPDGAVIRRAADCLRRGGLVAFPTETVYGLGVHAIDRDAVRRLFAAKGRPANDPLIVHVADAAALGPLVRATPPAVAALAARFWPGPLTLVLPRGGRVPDEVTAGRDTVAVRVPAHPVAAALLAAAGLPVAAPSANLFSRPSPTAAAHVLADLDGRIDMVVDGGPTTVGVESTVLDLTGDVARILRPGAVTIEMLRTVLGDVEAGADESAPLASPGLLARHYAPRTTLVLFEGGAATLHALADEARAARAMGRAVGVLATDEDRDTLQQLGITGGHVQVRTLGSVADLERIASQLYAALRELDDAGLDLLLARALPVTAGLGAAIADRLRRAAHERRSSAR